MPPKCLRCGTYHMGLCDDGYSWGMGKRYPRWRRVKREIIGFVWKYLKLDFTSKNVFHYWKLKNKREG